MALGEFDHMGGDEPIDYQGEAMQVAKLTKDSPIAAIRWAVAEAVGVPCPTCVWGTDLNPKQCRVCGSTGQVYPLQEICPCLHVDCSWDGINHLYDTSGCKVCWRKQSHEECLVCDGTDWVPATDPDAYLRTIQALGWTLNVYSNPLWEGNEVSLYTTGGPDWQCLGHIDQEEGLWNSHAVLVVFARALGVME